MGALSDVLQQIIDQGSSVADQGFLGVVKKIPTASYFARDVITDPFQVQKWEPAISDWAAPRFDQLKTAGSAPPLPNAYNNPFGNLSNDVGTFLYGSGNVPSRVQTPILGTPTGNTPTEMRGGTSPLSGSTAGTDIPTPNFKALQMGLEQNRKALLAARDQAIRKNGSAAGAQYNDAIARVDQQIAQMEEAKRETDSLYAGVQAGSQNLFDQAIANANFGPEAQAAQQKLAVQQQVQTRQDFDKIYSDTTDVLSRIGVDDQTAHVVAGKVKEVQNQIEDSAELQSGYREQIASLSGELAQAAATYAGAKSAADLERKRVMAQLGIDKNLQDLAQQKEDLIKARARAVSAARRATADQYNGLVPKSADEYGQLYVFEMLREHGVEPGQQQIISQLAQGLSGPYQMNDGRVLKSGAQQYSDVERAVLEAVSQDGSVAWTPEQVKLYTPIVWQAVQVQREGVDYYTNTLSSGSAADSRYFAPNSMDRTIFNYTHSVIPGVNESEAMDYALSEAATGIYYPRRPESYIKGLSR